MSRVRLSLETDRETKQQLKYHGARLGHTSLIGAIRACLVRSTNLYKAMKTGVVVLREPDGTETVLDREWLDRPR